MLNKLRGLLALLLGAPPRAADRQRRRFVPGLECLEDRMVPATFTVTTTLDVVNPADGKLSLREAITRANANPGADTIVVPAGIYRLALAGTDNTNATGDLDVTGSTLFRGAGAGATIIDGQQLDRVFDVLGTAPHSIKVTFQGLTVRNGLTDDGGGGGIRVGNADLVVQDCTVTGNRTSGSGGGISNAALPGTGNVTLVRTTVNRNVALVGGGLSVGSDIFGQGSVLNVSGSTIQSNLAREGGGIAAFQANLTGSTVSGNQATGSDGDDLVGGGIAATNVNLTNSTVSGNSAGRLGGGIFASTATLTNSTVSGNTAGRDGGGIDAAAVTTLTSSTVSDNHAGGDAGGIDSFMVTLTKSTVSGNTAGGDGGAIFASTANLTNSTVSDNIAGGEGGGIWTVAATRLTNSTVSGNFANGIGGGIKAGTANLTNSTVSGNHGDDGGGIEADTANLTNSTVSGNLAGEFGGGIHADTVTLTNSTVTGNGANDSGGGLAVGNATLTNSTVSGNSASDAGGGILADGTVTLTNSTVSGNSAGGDGGGIFASTVTLTNSTVSGNTAGVSGGGIFANTATLTNSTVSGNSAGDNGGGILAGGVTLLNVTVTDNSAHAGGGVFLQANGGTSSVRNTIIAANLVDLQGVGPDVSGAFTSGGHNLIGDGSGATGFANGSNGDQVGTAANPIDPRLAPLANNGGPTQTHALLAGSPAIDRGDNTGAPATDQRGVARPRDGDGNGSRIVDIGAFEK